MIITVKNQTKWVMGNRIKPAEEVKSRRSDKIGTIKEHLKKEKASVQTNVRVICCGCDCVIFEMLTVLVVNTVHTGCR